MTVSGSTPSPYWVAATFNAAGTATSQKGRHTVVVDKPGADSSFDVSFPAHPDGARYVVLHSSTEFHNLIHNQTPTGFRLYTRKSTNAQGTEGEGDVSLVILA